MESTQHSSSPRDTNPVLVLLAFAFWLVGGILAFLYGDKWFMPEAASVEAESIDALFRFMLGIATFIFLMVETCVFYFGIRYGLLRNRSDNTDGPPIHGNSTVEIVWTLIPAFIVFILTVYSLDVLISTTEAREDETALGVTAQQFFWQFNYPVEGTDGEELILSSNHVLVVPEDENIVLEMSSQDVIHSFWVPEFRVKQDVMPGRVTEVRFKPSEATGFDPQYLIDANITDPTLIGDIDALRTDIDALQTSLDEINAVIEAEQPTDEVCAPFNTEAGAAPDAEVAAEEAVSSNAADEEAGGSVVPPVAYNVGYEVVCTELCGANHGVMRGHVFVVEAEIYEAFIERLRLQSELQSINNDLAIACGGAKLIEAGRAIFIEQNCIGCHQLADAESFTVTTGPNLNGIGSTAETRVGDVYATDLDYIRTSIINPNAYIVDGYSPNIMPQDFIAKIPADELEILVNYLAMQDE